MIRKKILLVLVSLVVVAIALPCFAGKVTYEYDDLYRLTKTIYPNGRVIEYTYDKAGNRLSVITGKLFKYQVDFDGDGATDIAVWRPSNGMWYIKDQPYQAWGNSGDIPVPGDYGGDGATDIAVWRPSNGMWYIKDQPYQTWGNPDDIPVPGDYDGDGTTDIAVWRPSNGMWYIKDQPYQAWGNSGDIPVPGDYGGDGATDIAVWRPSNGMWYIKDQPYQAWGNSGDIPLAWNIWILKQTGLIP